MPNPSRLQQPISRTEIKQAVVGLIADAFSIGACQVRDDVFVRFVGVPVGNPPRSLTWVAVIVAQLQRVFRVRLEDAHTPEFRAKATVGDLIALVEGALSAERREGVIA